MLVPYRQWPVYFLAALPAHIAAELNVGMHWPQMWVAFATNCAVASLRLGVRYLVGRPPWLEYLPQGAGPMCWSPQSLALPRWPWEARSYASQAATTCEISGCSGSSGMPRTRWRASHLELCCLRGSAKVTIGWSSVSGSRRSEALLLAAGLVLACGIAFSAGTLTMPSYMPAFLYLPLPLILWAAVRFRTVGASAAILVVTITSISVTLKGPTVFAGADAEADVLALQLFLVAVSVPTPLLAHPSTGCAAQRVWQPGLLRLLSARRTANVGVWPMVFMRVSRNIWLRPSGQPSASWTPPPGRPVRCQRA